MYRHIGLTATVHFTKRMRKINLGMSLTAVLLFEHALLCCVAATCLDLSNTSNKDKYFHGNVLKPIKHIGFQQCRKACGKRTDCLSVNYHREQLTCEMISTPTHQGTFESRAGFVHAVKETVNDCTKINCSLSTGCFLTKIGTPVCLQNPYPSHCQEIPFAQLEAHDVHKIYPFGSNSSLEVKCKVIQKEVWTIIQKRFDGTEDFYRSWEEYKRGFGNATGEYWIGNEALHALTSKKISRLFIEFENWQNNTANASYTNFSVGDENSKYKLSVSGFSGNAGDSMKNNNGRVFSTKDRNMYTVSNGELCAVRHKSGWWHGKYSTFCPYANLNGIYSHVTVGYSTMYWHYWFNNFIPLKSSAMMISF